MFLQVQKLISLASLAGTGGAEGEGWVWREGGRLTFFPAPLKHVTCSRTGYGTTAKPNQAKSTTPREGNGGILEEEEEK